MCRRKKIQTKFNLTFIVVLAAALIEYCFFKHTLDKYNASLKRWKKNYNEPLPKELEQYKFINIVFIVSFLKVYLCDIGKLTLCTTLFKLQYDIS